MPFGGGFGVSVHSRGPIDLSKVKSQHTEFLGANDRLIADTLRQVADRAVWYARTTNKVRFRTGTMAHGWKATPVHHTSLGLLLSLISDVKHAFFHEEGTGLFGPTRDYIRPRRARFLRWVEDGRVHFARKVRGVPAKFIAKHSWFQAGFFEGPAMFERATGRLCRRF